MPSGLSTPAAEALGAFFLQAAAFPTYPAAFGVALYTTPPAADGTGGVEVADSAYVRASVTRSAANFPKVATATWSNANVIAFSFSATTTFTVSGLGLVDGSGNLLVLAELDRNVTFHSADQVGIPAGLCTFRGLNRLPSGWMVVTAEQLGNSFFQAAAAPSYPASWFVALMSTPFDQSGAGGLEAIGNGYARVEVTRSTANFPKTSSGTWKNGNTIGFPNATGSYSVSQVGLFDAATGGNLKAIATLDTTASFVTGNIVQFSQSALTFRFSLGASALISWDSSGDVRTVGYRLEVGTASGQYVTSWDVGNVLSSTVYNLPTGRTYYFAATDYNSSGGQSVTSNEIVRAL